MDYAIDVVPYSADASLICALGPDAARLLADAMEAVEDGCVVFTHTAWQQTYFPLLARFSALGQDEA
jgi:hypothetical protein